MMDQLLARNIDLSNPDVLSFILTTRITDEGEVVVVGRRNIPKDTFDRLFEKNIHSSDKLEMLLRATK
jgi:hypothetical protein